MKLYRIIANPEGEARLGEVKQNLAILRRLFDRYSQSGVLFAALELSDDEVKLVALDKQNQGIDTVREQAAALLIEFNRKLTYRRILEISYEAFTKLVDQAFHGGFFSLADVIDVIPGKAEVKNLVAQAGFFTEEGARIYLMKRALSSALPPKAELFGCVQHGKWLVMRETLDIAFEKWADILMQEAGLAEADEGQEQDTRTCDSDKGAGLAQKETEAKCPNRQKEGFAHPFEKELQAWLHEMEGKSNDADKPGDEDRISAFERLNRMIGLSEVKKWIVKFTAVVFALKQYPKRSKPRYNHIVFSGKPGTAKTTVARLLGEILFEIGVTRSKEIIELGRAQVVGQYVGSTAPLVEAIFTKAKEEGQLIFLDEAYALVDDRTGSYGDEAISTFVRLMENNPEVTVIFAGYPDEMQSFIDKNPGLKSRINWYIDFPEYSEDELLDILELIAAENGFRLETGMREAVRPMIASAMKGSDSGNGRLIRNMLEAAEINWAFRITAKDEKEVTEIDKVMLYAEDFEQPETLKGKKQIGFQV